MTGTSGEVQHGASGIHALLRQHRLRNADLAFWWYLPDDPTRTRSPWAQLARDLTAHAPFSEWHERIAITRVRHYDRIRTNVCRGVLLAAVAATLLVLHAPWVLLVMLVPGAVQVALEIHLHRYVVSREEAPTRVARWMTDLQRTNFETLLVNATGLIGVIAVPLNVLAVCLAPSGGELGWVKVAGLAAAVFYCNSALRSTFLDPPNYTEQSTMPLIMHAVRPYAALLATAIIAAVVGIGQAMDRWEPAVQPLAYLTAGLALLLGAVVRDHDRMLWAAIPTARDAIVEGRQNLGQVMHDDLGAMKAAALEAAACPALAMEHRLELQSLEAFLTGFSTRVGLDNADPMNLAKLAEKLVDRYGVLARDVTVRDELGTTGTTRADYRVVLKLATALLHNAGQALGRDVPAERRRLTVRAWSTGSDRETMFHVAVDDRLSLIPVDRWCTPGSTLAALRDWLSATYGGDLAQAPHADGKSITASWYDRQPRTEMEALEAW